MLSKKYQDPECTTRFSLPLTASPGTSPSPAQTCLLIPVDISLLDMCAYHVPCCFQIVLIFWIDLGFELTVLSDGCWTCDAGVGCCCSYHPYCVHLVWDWRICTLLVVLLHCLRCGHLHSTAVLLFYHATASLWKGWGFIWNLACDSSQAVLRVTITIHVISVFLICSLPQFLFVSPEIVR